MPASPPFVTIDATGIHVATFADILSWLTGKFQATYGSDIDLDSDTQDGELVGILAQAFYDEATSVLAAYEAYSPSTAQGVGLSSIVKINGIRRQTPSNSTAVVDIEGTVGTPILNGKVGSNIDDSQWLLPPSVVIPPLGIISVTAVCATLGSIEAAAGTLTRILTPTRGWQSVTNPLPAALGIPVELDSLLRQRQSVSTALPSRAILDGIEGALLNLPGVANAVVYENDSSATDSNGIPAHEIAPVIIGGVASDIASTVFLKKTTGTGTFGTTTVTVFDSYGIPHRVSYFVASAVRISAEISIHVKSGYSTVVGVEIQNAVAAYISSLPPRRIGQSVIRFQVAASADTLITYDITGEPTRWFTTVVDSTTYNVEDVKLARSPGSPVGADVPLLFNEYAFADPSDVTVTLV